MSWTPALFLRNVTQFFGGFNSDPGGSLAQRTEDIRQSMLDCLGASGCQAFPLTERKVRSAKDVQDLWYLRADVMTALSALQGERLAREKVEIFSPKFRGLLPSNLDRRSSRF